MELRMVAVASKKFGMNRPAVIRTYMDIWIGLDHVRFGMDRGMDRPMNDVLRQENAMVQKRGINGIAIQNENDHPSKKYSKWTAV